MREKWTQSLTLFIVFFCIWWGYHLSHELRAIKLDVSKYAIKTENDGYKYYLDETTMTNEYVQISGWAVEKSTDTRKVDIKVVLKRIGCEEYYKIPTGNTERHDVTEYFHDGYNYDKSGFTLKLPTKRQYHLDDNEYEIFLLYKANGSAPCLIRTSRNVQISL